MLKTKETHILKIVCGYIVTELHEFCVLGSLQLLRCNFCFEEETATSLEVHIWAWQTSEGILNSEISISQLVNTQNFCTNFCSQNYNRKLKVFITPHRTEVLILFPICRCLNVSKNSLWRKRRCCQWWSPGTSPFFCRLSRTCKPQW